LAKASTRAKARTRAKAPARRGKSAARVAKVGKPRAAAPRIGAAAPRAAAATAVTVRKLAASDLDAVVAIDAPIMGRSRRAYHERRLRAARQQPGLHVQFAVDGPKGLAGYLLARKLHGQFGRAVPAFRLEMIAVAPDRQARGVGTALMRALEAEARKQGVPEIRTSAAWKRHDMLRFLDHAGFELGRNVIVNCSVHAGRLTGSGTEAVTAPEATSWSQEINYGAQKENDYEALERDAADVRTLAADDLPDLTRVDRRVTGQDRAAYVRQLVDEALNDSAIRVSLTARVDGIVAGFVAARTDFGDFGRTEPVAVLDTIAVDPDFAHQGVGHALLSQLFVNLHALRVERVETVVSRDNFPLLGFLYSAGFEQSERLGFVKPVA
jgi:ribosomal protein S18 acetylase RimI-like enzyme